MSIIAVAGATGTLGRHVIAAIAARGHAPRIVSRHPRPARTPRDIHWETVDYRSRAGVADAFADADAIVVATSAFKDAATVRAIASAAPATAHLVYVSIVGVDAVPMPYYRQKLAAERAVVDSGLPWTILRATQFHDLAASMLRAAARPPVMFLPRGVRLQPISAPVVAERLAILADGEPLGRAPDLGGPVVTAVTDLARQYLDARHLRRRIVEVPVPGRFAQSLAAGGLTTANHAIGTQTFAEYLATSPGPRHLR